MTVYFDIDKVPLDEYSVPDVGDEHSQERDKELLLATTLKPKLFGVIPQNHVSKTTPHFVIPFQRTIELDVIGRDVVGAKRALWKANDLPIPIHATQLFGVGAVAQLRKFQKVHSLTADGVLGPTTLTELAPYFDSLAYFDYVGYPPGSTKQSRIVAYCLWGYNNRGGIGYWQFRPMQYMYDLERLPVNEDCSTFSTKAYKFGGAKDPNGMSPPYNGIGNTQTQRAHGTQVRVSQCLPGDLAHYDNPQHVGVVVSGGVNARVVEHGSGIGPLLLGINYRPLTYVMRYSM